MLGSRDLSHAALLATVFATAGCVRSRSAEQTAPPPSPSSTEPTPTSTPTIDASDDPAAASPSASPPPSAIAWIAPPPAEIDGPHEELSLDAGRPIYYAAPRGKPVPLRLVGHLHGMCTPPPYSCGKWLGAGTDVGFVVCPTGNARCGDSPVGPASWEAPTWAELVVQMDADLEAAIAKVAAKRPGAFDREGAVLTGYSRGAFAVPAIARRHPRRWPYLVLVEANVTLTKAALDAAGVRAVALVAGEWGTELPGMDKTQRDLADAGFAAKLFVMRKTGHPYSEDIAEVMHDALTFVLAEPGRQSP